MPNKQYKAKSNSSMIASEPAATYLTSNQYGEVFEPDDDLRGAITIAELREKMHKRIHELFASK